MKPKQKLGLFLTIGLLALGVAWYSQIRILPVAPNALFKTIKGESIALADLKGKPVLVTFWATDCPSCIEEIPHLINLHQQFNPLGLTIIAVAMYYDPPNRVLEMAEAKQLPYAVALDPIGEHAKAFGNVQYTPTSFLIDSSGMIVMQKVGVLDLASLHETSAILTSQLLW